MARRCVHKSPRSKRDQMPDREPGSDELPSESSGAAKASDLDDLLDEIDDLLESNAEDFVKSYVQKGGQ